jgi:hypothetical protein
MWYHCNLNLCCHENLRPQLCTLANSILVGLIYIPGFMNIMNSFKSYYKDFICILQLCLVEEFCPHSCSAILQLVLKQIDHRSHNHKIVIITESLIPIWWFEWNWHSYFMWISVFRIALIAKWSMLWVSQFFMYYLIMDRAIPSKSLVFPRPFFISWSLGSKYWKNLMSVLCNFWAS